MGNTGDEGIIGFKDDECQTDWCSGNLNPLLAQIFLVAAQYSYRTLLNPLTVTSIYRSPSEDSAAGGHGIHCEWRAIDVHADSWSDPKIESVAAFVNSLWEYDPSRPNLKVAVWEPHGTGPHLHLQVHPSTHRKGVA